MTTVWMDAVFKPFFKIVHDTAQQLTVDRTNSLTDGFLQIIQRTGFVSVKTRFQVPPKKKITRWKIGRARGPRHVSETGNEVPGKHVSNNGRWLVCSVRCDTILLKPHIGTVPHPSPSPPLGLPTEYYPFERCQVPVGHPVPSSSKVMPFWRRWQHTGCRKGEKFLEYLTDLFTVAFNKCSFLVSYPNRNFVHISHVTHTDNPTDPIYSLRNFRKLKFFKCAPNFSLRQWKHIPTEGRKNTAGR